MPNADLSSSADETKHYVHLAFGMIFSVLFAVVGVFILSEGIKALSRSVELSTSGSHATATILQIVHKYKIVNKVLVSYTLPNEKTALVTLNADDAFVRQGRVPIVFLKDRPEMAFQDTWKELWLGVIIRLFVGCGFTLFPLVTICILRREKSAL
jgi:hypothetical protein